MTPRFVLIIGASSSIGGAIVDCFSKAGDEVLATYHRHNSNKFGPQIVSTSLDITSDKSRKELSSCISKRSKIDVALFLPSLLLGKNLGEYSDSEIDEVVSVNLSGQIKLLRELLPLFATDSQVLTASSISAERGSYDPVYAATKGAILSLVKSLASWLAPKIRVNALAPGLIENSSMLNGFEEGRKKAHLSQIPMGRFLSQTDLASVIYDLTQKHWSHLNGACIDLNGGQYLR